MPDLKSTYIKLKYGGANVGSFEDFQKAMKDENKVSTVYKALSSNGDINESYEDFKSNIFTSDKTTGNSLPTIDEVEKKKQEEKRKKEESQNAVPENDFLISRIGGKPEQKQEFPETKKIPVGSKIVQDIPKDDIITERINKQLITNQELKPKNSYEEAYLKANGPEIYYQYKTKQQRAKNKEVLKGIFEIGEDDPDQAYRLIPQELKDDPNMFVKDIAGATSKLTGIDPKLYKSPEQKTLRNKREELYNQGQYAGKAMSDFNELKKLSEKFIPQETTRKTLGYTTGVIGVGIYDMFHDEVTAREYGKVADNFLQNNAKAKGYDNPAESLVDLFVTPLSPDQKKLTRIYIDQLSKIDPYNYGLFKEKMFRNLFNSKDIEQDIVINAIDLNKKVLERGLSVAKQKGYLDQFAKNVDKKREFIKSKDELDKLESKLSGMEQDPSNPEFINLADQYQKLAKQTEDLQKQIIAEDEKPYNKAANELSGELINNYNKILDYEKKAFYNKNKSLFTEEAIKREKYNQDIERLTAMRNSNNPIIQQAGEYEIVGRQAWNSLTNYISGAVSLGVGLGGIISDALGGNNTKYNQARWQEEINNFSEKLSLNVPEMKLVNEDNSVNWENALPTVAKTMSDMALLIVGGNIGSIKSLGLSEKIANSIGLVISGTAFEFKGQYDEALKAGLQPLEAVKKAFNTSIAIGALELVNPNTKLLTGFKYTNKAIKDLVKNKHWINSTGAYLKELGHETAGEIIQEFSQSAAEYGINGLYNEVYGKNKFQAEFSPGEALETAMLTAAATILLHSSTQGANNITPGNYNQRMYDFALAELAKDDKSFVDTKKALFDARNNQEISDTKYKELMNDLAYRRQAQIKSDLYRRPDYVPTPELKRLLTLQSKNNDLLEKDKDNILLKEVGKNIKAAIEAEIVGSTAEYLIDGKKVKQGEFVNSLNDPNVIKKMADDNISLKVYGDDVMSKHLKMKYDNAKKLKASGVITAIDPASGSNSPEIERINTELENQRNNADNTRLQNKYDILESETIITDEIKKLAESDIGILLQEKANLENDLSNVDIADNYERRKILKRIEEIDKQIAPVISAKKAINKEQQKKAEEAKNLADKQSRQEFATDKEAAKPNESGQQQVTEQQLQTQKETETEEMLSGKLVWASPGTGKSFYVKSKKSDKYVDADELIKNELSKRGVKNVVGVGEAINSYASKNNKQIKKKYRDMSPADRKADLYNTVYSKIEKLKAEGKIIFTGSIPFRKNADVAILKEKVDKQYQEEAGNRKVSPMSPKALLDSLSKAEKEIGDLPTTMRIKEGEHVSDVMEGKVQLPEAVKESIKREKDKINALSVEKEAAINSNDKKAQEKVLDKENKIREQEQKERNKEIIGEGMSRNDLLRNRPSVQATVEDAIDRKNFCK